MTALVDSHCHLDFKAFDEDRDEIVAGAKTAGLVAIINPGVDLPSSRAAVELADKYPAVFAAVGVHPHEARSFDRQAAAELRQLARHPKVVAIGETGLDYYRNLSPHNAQQTAFAAQLALASELGLPVIVHNRDATPETLAALESWAASDGSRRGVLHSYSAGLDGLEATLAMGFYVGISGPVTFPGATALHRVAQQVPLDRLLVETDAPYLTPAPHRGRRNQPAYVQCVAEKVAALRGLTYGQVGEQTTENVLELFRQIGRTRDK